MLEQFNRTSLLIGKHNIKKLNTSKIMVFGIGGVGSFAVEGLARAGIENFILIDNDIISMSNINRQIHANIHTIGKYKVDVMKDRILEINPNAYVETYKEFYLPENTSIPFDNSITYIIDAIDTITAKIELVVKAKELNIPIISCMGTGNKLDPTKFEVADIYSTSVCPLAKVMRKELGKRNIDKLKVVYSKETPIKIDFSDYIETNDFSKKSSDNDSLVGNLKQIPGSISFVPPVAGFILCSEVVKDIISN